MSEIGRPPRLTGYKPRREEEDELDKMVEDILSKGNKNNNTRPGEGGKSQLSIHAGGGSTLSKNG